MGPMLATIRMSTPYSYDIYFGIKLMKRDEEINEQSMPNWVNDYESKLDLANGNKTTDLFRLHFSHLCFKRPLY